MRITCADGHALIPGDTIIVNGKLCFVVGNGVEYFTYDHATLWQRLLFWALKRKPHARIYDK